MEKRDVVSLSRDIEHRLQARYDDPVLCNQYAWWMIERVTEKKKEELISLGTFNFTTKQIYTLENWLQKQIVEKEPLQYLLGSLPFDNLEILVEPPILIPRPETEEMCYKIIAKLKKLEKKAPKAISGFTILDIGTGSGCIALTLAKAFDNAHVYAIDISQEALDLAKKNAKHNNIKNITFLESDVYNNIPKDIKFDLIVSNPPYIAQKEWETLDESVTKWEDKIALVANKEGMAIIERIVMQAPEFIKSNSEIASKKIPQLIIEIGYAQGPGTKKLFQAAGFVDIVIEKDLEGKDRFVSGRVDNVVTKKGKE
ncbi:peptide chain release factor N(5)-glutamine methyltransferase [Candidatus Dependentiae bacterium]